MTTVPSLRIAVADDDRDIRDFLARFIPLLGHVVHSVSANGRALMEACRADPPDMIIADIQMPDMSGLEAIEAICRRTPVPAVLISGHAVPEWLDRARAI